MYKCRRFGKLHSINSLSPEDDSSDEDDEKAPSVYPLPSQLEDPSNEDEKMLIANIIILNKKKKNRNCAVKEECHE